MKFNKNYLAALLLFLPSLSFADDAITISSKIAKLAESQFYERNFVAINEDEYEYRTAQSRLPDGRWKLTFIYSNLGNVARRGDEVEWKKKINLVDEWIQKTPSQPAAYLAKAEILISYAWDARGGGWANSVTPEQWRIFHKRISEARKILEDSYEITKGNPYWFLEMEVIAKAQSWAEEEFDALYQAAVTAVPTYYFIHFRAADYYQPRWNGSKEKLRAFVDNAVSKSKSSEGMTLYARIYWSQLWALQNKTFDDGYGEWDNMRQGFEDIMQQYPRSSWNLNAFAYYACMAKDWETFRRLSSQIGDQPHLSIWEKTSKFSSCKKLSK